MTLFFPLTWFIKQSHDHENIAVTALNFFLLLHTACCTLYHPPLVPLDGGVQCKPQTIPQPTNILFAVRFDILKEIAVFLWHSDAVVKDCRLTARRLWEDFNSVSICQPCDRLVICPSCMFISPNFSLATIYRISGIDISRIDGTLLLVIGYFPTDICSVSFEDIMLFDDKRKCDWKNNSDEIFFFLCFHVLCLLVKWYKGFKDRKKYVVKTVFICLSLQQVIDMSHAKHSEKPNRIIFTFNRCNRCYEAQTALMYQLKT